jgi:hypothetical protein
MEHSEQQTPVQLEIEQLTASSRFHEVVRGVGVALGLGLLWALEVIRNAYFHALDRLNLKPRRRRRASAFPPGQPRKHHAV